MEKQKAAAPEAKKTEVSATKAKPQGLTQREAVYIEVMRIVRDEKIVVGEKKSVKAFLNEAQIKKICVALMAGFQSKKIPLKDTESNRKKLSDAKAIELYCLGLLNNWLRRDKRLNGNGETKQ